MDSTVSPESSHENPRRIIQKDFYDEKAALEEMKRVLEICNGCRRCFNLCSFFPRFFEMMDGEILDFDIENLTSQHLNDLIPQCTLCDMCFINKCPYVWPHPWALDLPRLILRWRAIQNRKKMGWKNQWFRWVKQYLSAVDRWGFWTRFFSFFLNPFMKWKGIRYLMATFSKVHPKADLPPFAAWKKKEFSVTPNKNGPFYGRHGILFISCMETYYRSHLTQLSLKLFAQQGWTLHPFYHQCCGVPLLEQGLIEQGKQGAEKLSAALLKKWELVQLLQNQNHHALFGAHYTPKNVPIVALTPSCAWMMTSEWPSLSPENETMKTIAHHTMDLSTFALQVFQEEKVQLPPLVVHVPCHVRAQNKGNSAFRLMEKISSQPVFRIEKCAGHGGMWGYMEPFFQNAIGMGSDVMRKAQDQLAHFQKPWIVVTDCPLAARHLRQSAQECLSEQKSNSPACSQACKGASCQKSFSYGGLQEKGILDVDGLEYPTKDGNFLIVHPLVLLARHFGVSLESPTSCISNSLCS